MQYSLPKKDGNKENTDPKTETKENNVKRRVVFSKYKA